MDSSENPHNSHCDTSDQLNIISSTSDVEVEPVNQTIATTSVLNSTDDAIDHKISSSLDNSSSTCGVEVTKSNEFTLTNVHEQNKTESCKIVETSKPVPVKQIVETITVINSSKINEKNIKAHNINISLEQKKIENFKIIDNNNVEIPIQRAVPLTKIIPNTFLINAPKKNENNIGPNNSHCDLGGLLNNNNSTRGIEVSKLNQSTSTKVQEQNKTVHFKTVDNNDVKISNQQIPLKKMIATTYVINAPKKNENNIYIKPNNYPLNLEKIAVPKTVLSNMKLIPPTFSNQIKKPQTISLMPGTTLIKPNTTIITRLQPKLYPSGITNKCVPTLKHGFKIVSSNDPNSKMFLLPQGVNYVIKTLNKEDVKNQSLPSCSSTSTMFKTLNKVEVKNQPLPSFSSTSTTMLKTLNKEEVKNRSLPSCSSTSAMFKTLNKVEVKNQPLPSFSSTSTMIKTLNKEEVKNQSLPSGSSTSTMFKTLNKVEVKNQPLPSFSSTSTMIKTLNKEEVKNQSLPNGSSTSTMFKTLNKVEVKNQPLPSLSSTSTMIKTLNKEEVKNQSLPSCSSTSTMFKTLNKVEVKNQPLPSLSSTSTMIKTLNKEEVKNQSLPSCSSTSTMFKTLNKVEVKNQPLPSLSSTSTMIKTLNKEEVKNQSLPSCSSTSTMFKTLNKVEVKNQPLPSFSSTSTTMIKTLNKEEVKNQSLPSCSSTSTMFKTLNKVEVKNQPLPSFSSTSTTMIKTLNKEEVKNQSLPICSSTSTMFKTLNKVEVKNQPLPSFSSTSTMLKPLNSIIPITVAEKFNTIEKPKLQNKNSKFVVRWKEFQNQRYQVLPNEKTIINENNKHLFESNTHFELLFPRSSKSFIRNQKRSLKSHTDTPKSKVMKITDTSESNHVQKKSEQSFRTLTLNTIKNSIDFGGTSGQKKYIPHTITSKDVIDFGGTSGQKKYIPHTITSKDVIDFGGTSGQKKYIPHTITSKDVIDFGGTSGQKKYIPHTITSKDVIDFGGTSGQKKYIPHTITSKDVIDFGGTSGQKKYIPHTITSKDVIDNHTNLVIENNKTKLNTELCPPSGFIQLSSRPESSILKTYGQSLTVTKYGNFSNNELSTVRLVPYGSINQSQTKGDGKQLFIKILKNNGSTSNSTIATVSTDKIMKVIPTTVYAPKNTKINIAAKGNQRKILLSKPNTIKLLLPTNVKKEQVPGYCENQFVHCLYEYCRTLVNESEMIDNLYCSLICKKLDNKLRLATEKTIVIPQPPPEEESPKKPVIDRKLLLAKLKSRINKRKQSLPSFPIENEAQHVNLGKVVQPDNEACQIPPPIPVTVKRSFQKSENKRKSSGPTTFIENLKQENAKILSYLEHTNYIPAPKKLFDNPFPSDFNAFKVGQRLEGIDPEHEALFCVMTVVEVVGYRIKLHFDGYRDIYDFWVNANCPDIFFPRWCEQNSRTLQPPKNYKQKFCWTDYLKLTGVTPAPKWNFPCAIYFVNREIEHSFRIGAKLEALDKLTRTLPKQLICVSTVADILGNRIRIHFDGWTDDFDYWTDVTSTNIHPVGWCDKNGRTLCPPSGYDNCRGKKPFSWPIYLKETNSEPVPEDAFVRRPLREFTNTMAIEVVDIANPSLVRIAKVVDVKGDELKILYDGFDSIYAYWIEDDSPNIHPLGWCLKTNHPIELSTVNPILWSCRVPGCNGKGNTNSYKNTHVFAKDCPYEFESWKKSISGLTNTPDRLKSDDIPVSVPSCSKPRSIVPQKNKKKQNSKLNKMKSYNKPKRRKVNNKLKKNYNKKIPSGRSKTVYRRVVEAMDELEIIKSDNDYTSYGYGSFKLPRLNVWTRRNVTQGLSLFNISDVRKWPVEEVATFVEKVVSNNYTDNNPSEQIKISKPFINQEIDGDVFLMLTQEDLTNKLNIPLGPALKLHNVIVVLRQRTAAYDIANELIQKKK